MITSATDALSQIPEATAYARVDTVVVALWVLEIEVIDPTLFFDLHPPAAIWRERGRNLCKD
jgi:hypothetical protein